MWWQYPTWWQGNTKTGAGAQRSSKVLRPEALEDNRMELMDFSVSSDLHQLRMVVFFLFALFQPVCHFVCERYKFSSVVLIGLKLIFPGLQLLLFLSPVDQAWHCLCYARFPLDAQFPVVSLRCSISSLLLTCAFLWLALCTTCHKHVTSGFEFLLMSLLLKICVFSVWCFLA